MTATRQLKSCVAVSCCVLRVVAVCGNVLDCDWHVLCHDTIHDREISAKEPYISANEPYISTKETYISTKVFYAHVLCHDTIPHHHDTVAQDHDQATKELCCSELLCVAGCCSVRTMTL